MTLIARQVTDLTDPTNVRMAAHTASHRLQKLKHKAYATELSAKFDIAMPQVLIHVDNW